MTGEFDTTGHSQSLRCWRCCFIGVLFMALVAVLSGRGLPARVQHHLFHLSSGRLLGSIQFPGECDNRAPTNEWIARVGRKPSDLHTYSGVGFPTSPFLGHHMAISEKSEGMTETCEPRPMAASETKGHAPLNGYMRLEVHEQAQEESPHKAW